MGSLADRVQLLEQNSMLSELNVRVGSMEDRLRELAANAEAARMAAEAARSMAEESTMQSETRARRLQVDVDSKVPMDMLESVVLQKVGAAIAKEKEGTKKIKSAIKRIFSYLEDTVNPACICHLSVGTSESPLEFGKETMPRIFESAERPCRRGTRPHGRPSCRRLCRLRSSQRHHGFALFFVAGGFAFCVYNKTPSSPQET